MLDPQDVANDLIAGERERREIPQFSKSHGVEEFDLATRVSGAAVVRGGQAGGGAAVRRLQVGVDQPQQAAGDGGRRAVVWAGDQRDAGAVRGAGAVGPVHSSAGGVGDRVLVGPDVEPPATVVSVLAATEVVFGAVDVLDSRYEGFSFTLEDVVADNASAGAFYLGPRARRLDRAGGPAADRLRGPGRRGGHDDRGRGGGDGASGRVGGLAGRPTRRRRRNPQGRSTGVLRRRHRPRPAWPQAAASPSSSTAWAPSRSKAPDVPEHAWRF